MDVGQVVCNHAERPFAYHNRQSGLCRAPNLAAATIEGEIALPAGANLMPNLSGQHSRVSRAECHGVSRRERFAGQGLAGMHLHPSTDLDLVAKCAFATFHSMLRESRA
ncbi:MAG: hypothetical protein V4653_05855 [Pseudomonadota bacterium]